MKKMVCFVVVGLASFSAMGCTSLKGMKPPPAPMERKSAGTLLVRADLQQGGQSVPSLPAKMAFITLASLSQADLQPALLSSIQESGLFANVTDSAKADYELEVAVIGLTVTAGYNMNGTVTAEWKLRRTNDRRLLMQETIQTVGDATFSEAFTGTRRAALVVERATAENISDGITRLSGAKLD